MKPENIILRTKNAGDIVIDKSYISIYGSIDRLVTAKRKLFTGIVDEQAKRLFHDIEERTFGYWYSSTSVKPGDPAYSRIPVVETRD